jgi:hypothetical protein
MMTGLPSTMAATAEFVVPRSMPTERPAGGTAGSASAVRAVRPGRRPRKGTGRGRRNDSGARNRHVPCPGAAAHRSRAPAPARPNRPAKARGTRLRIPPWFSARAGGDPLPRQARARNKPARVRRIEKGGGAGVRGWKKFLLPSRPRGKKSFRQRHLVAIERKERRRV